MTRVTTLDPTRRLPAQDEKGVLARRLSSWFHAVSVWVRRLSGRGKCHDMDCAAFAQSIVPLAAKMAKADGVSIAIEAEAFEKFLNVPDQEVANVRRLYRQAEKDTAGYQAYADRIAALLQDSPETKQRVLECLFYIACSDGILHPAEDQFLQDVASRLGFDEVTVRSIRAAFVHDPDSAYTVLGLSPSANRREIKQRYRKLVSENHPDRLIASGAPPAAIEAANVRLAAINAAYEDIVRDLRQSERAK